MGNFAKTERRFLLATFKGRCFGGDDRWSVRVEFDSQQFFRSGDYPAIDFHTVDDPLPEKPDPATFSVGDRVWAADYVLRDCAAELRRRGIANAVLVQCIRSDAPLLAG